ncbi:MAG: hypothetical protein AAF721_05840, partial [Myxococcota bacterium]
GPDGAGRVPFKVGPHELRVVVPPDRFGWHYEPPEPIGRPLRHDDLSRAGARVLFGDQELNLADGAGSRTWWLTALGSGERPLATLHNDCAEVVGNIVSPPSVAHTPYTRASGPRIPGGRPGGSPGGVPPGILGGVGRIVYEARSGVPVYWPDGRAAGKVRHTVRFERQPVRRRDAVRDREILCFEALPGTDDADHLNVCFAEADLKIWGSPGPRL